MVLARFRGWLRLPRLLRQRPQDLRDDDPDVERARRRLEASSRLVSLNAHKSARALRRLNKILAVRARALEGIDAAESALLTVDKARDDK